MLQIKYQNEFLDIAPDQEGELEANNPMFLIDNVLAEYSTPLSIVYSDKNVQLLGPIFFNATIRTKQKFAVEIYKGDTYRCNGTLIIESAGIRRNARNSNASGYVLTGISSFFSDLKDVLLQKMDLGSGLKAFTTFLPYDGTDGFWQWFQESWSGNMDFVVAPVRNDNLNNDPENPSVWMNHVTRRLTGFVDGVPVYAPFNDLYTAEHSVYPFLKLKVAFQRIFETLGWTLDSSDIDADWAKLVLYSTFQVETYMQPSGLPQPFININYADLLPRNTRASSFILAFCKRYGWIPLCDAQERKCTIISLKHGDTGEVKDWTKYADPDVDSDFTEDDRIYSFKNNYTGNDGAIEDKDIADLGQRLTVNSKFDLPTPDVQYDEQAVFCYLENTWYGIDLDESNNRIWVPLKDNIYNDEPAGANASVETDCSTLPNIWAQFAQQDGVDYWGLFPYCSQPRNTDAGIRTLFFHGLVNEVKEDGTTGITTYPFLSATSKGPDGTVVNAWSNVFKHADASGNDDGIESYWFAKWLSYMKYAEVKTQNFNVPLHELVNYKWTDIVLINNIPHLIISYIEKLSQKNFIQAKLKRLISNAAIVAELPGIYVHFTWENIVSAPDIFIAGTHVGTNVLTGEMVIYCWSDAAGTVPLTPTSLKVKYRHFTQHNGVFFDGPYQTTDNEISLTAQRTSFTFNNVTGTNIKQYNDIAYFPGVQVNYDISLIEDIAYHIIS